MKHIAAVALLLAVPVMASTTPLSLLVPGSSAAIVIERLAVDCSDNGGALKSRSETEVTCAKPVSAGGVINQMGFYIYTQYAVAPDGDAALIRYASWGQIAKGDGTYRMQKAASAEKQSVTNRLRSIFHEAQ